MRSLSVMGGTLLAALLTVLAPVYGDVFHLRGGTTIEGEILEDLGEAYRIRVALGIVDIEKARIVRRVPGAPPWRRYETQRRKYADTPEDQYALSQWCEENGLRSQQLEHLRRTIALAPDHATARRKLGFVRKDGGWIKKRAHPSLTDEELEARRQAREQERLLRRTIAEWFVKIKAIHRGRLSGRIRDVRSAKFREGRKQILAIDDPLAIPALTGVLSTGDVAVRRILIEALEQFDVDEATMNLLVIALLDPSSLIREWAAVALIQRKDDRVIRQLRDALHSEEEGILRNAAAALGTLQAREAVEDLIAVLSTQERRRVLVSRPVQLGVIRATFIHGSWIGCGGRLVYYEPACIGVLGPGTMVGTSSWYEVRDVPIYRTEVQEALIAITGQNFGFDAVAWRRWWAQQRKRN